MQFTAVLFANLKRRAPRDMPDLPSPHRSFSLSFFHTLSLSIFLFLSLHPPVINLEGKRTYFATLYHFCFLSSYLSFQSLNVGQSFDVSSTFVIFVIR